MTETNPANTTTTANSAFLREMASRGAVHQCSDWNTLDAAMSKGTSAAYIGFDATADSLHVGHLMSIMSLRRLQRNGHKPIVLMGGGTTRIGDPSFRDTTRPLLDDKQIAANIEGIRKVFARFLDFGDGPTDAVMVNNADWLDSLGYISFLREFGRHFSVNRMLAMDSVKSRLEREQPMSFLEFNYMLLQAFDFVELSKRFGCLLQMGGSDQWGNIVTGIDLGRRVCGAELFGLTTPLLSTASGQKMGKSLNGAVWLNEDKLSPFDYWQFWRNVEDADIGRFLRLFTDLPETEIAGFETLEGSRVNEAKIALANETTSMLHGRDAALAAAETARKVFAEGANDDGVGLVEIAGNAHPAGMGILDAMVACGLTTTKGEARRLIAGGGARMDGVPITDEHVMLKTTPGGQHRLSAGKKRHAIMRFA
jgi:tyrosyl-tRNA synthetase